MSLPGLKLLEDKKDCMQGISHIWFTPEDKKIPQEMQSNEQLSYPEKAILPFPMTIILVSMCISSSSQLVGKLR